MHNEHYMGLMKLSSLNRELDMQLTLLMLGKATVLLGQNCRRSHWAEGIGDPAGHSFDSCSWRSRTLIAVAK